MATVIDADLLGFFVSSSPTRGANLSIDPVAGVIPRPGIQAQLAGGGAGAPAFRVAYPSGHGLIVDTLGKAAQLRAAGQGDVGPWDLLDAWEITDYTNGIKSSAAPLNSSPGQAPRWFGFKLESAAASIVVPLSPLLSMSQITITDAGAISGITRATRDTPAGVTLPFASLYEAAQFLPVGPNKIVPWTLLRWIGAVAGVTWSVV